MIGYRTACSELWLLMVADGSTISRTVDLEDFHTDAVLTSSFDRVFLLADGRHVLELRVQPPRWDR